MEKNNDRKYIYCGDRTYQKRNLGSLTYCSLLDNEKKNNPQNSTAPLTVMYVKDLHRFFLIWHNFKAKKRKTPYGAEDGGVNS